MKKRCLLYFVTAFIAVLFLLCVNRITVNAQDTSWQNEYDYTLDDSNNTITLTGYHGEGGDVVIPSSAVIGDKTYQVVVTSTKKVPFFPEDNIVSFTAKDGVKFLNLSCFFLGWRDNGNNYYVSGRRNLIAVTFEKVDTSAVTDMSYMFTNCFKLENLDLSNLDTSNVEDMSYMFFYCNSLKNVNLTGFNTEKVNNMDEMFAFCDCLTGIDLSSFNTSNVNSMYRMFCWCKSLTNLDLSGFSTSNVRNMSGMFHTCTGLTNLNLSSFDTGSVTDFKELFISCTSLENLDLSGFSTVSATNMSRMFQGCDRLSDLDISSFDTANVTDFSDMFEGCNSLEVFDISHFDASNALAMGGMFDSCEKLDKIITPKKINPDMVKTYLPHMMFILDQDGNLGETGYKYLNNVPAGVTLVYMPLSDRLDLFVAPEGCAYQFRLYNPYTGEHFYTGSKVETINLVDRRWGWDFEGSGFITPTVGDPIYRLFSEEHNDHFYTTDESERDALLAEHWTLDGGTGIAFPSAPEATGKPMYRLYNPNAYPNGEAGAHHFTMSWEEVENLEAEGWQFEFIAWYSV